MKNIKRVIRDSSPAHHDFDLVDAGYLDRLVGLKSIIVLLSFVCFREFLYQVSVELDALVLDSVSQEARLHILRLFPRPTLFLLNLHIAIEFE